MQEKDEKVKKSRQGKRRQGFQKKKGI